MGLIIDTIVLVIVVISIILGIKNGLIKSLLSVVAFFAAVLISLNCSQTVATFLNESFIEPKIVQNVSESIENNSNDIISAIPKFIVNRNQIDVEKFQNDYYNNQHLENSSLANLIVVNNVRPIINAILTPFCSVILFLLLSTIFSFFARILNKLIKVLPVGLLNKFGGALLGGIKGIIFSVIFCLIVSSILYFKENGFLFITDDAVNSSYFYKLFTNFLA